MSYTLIQQRRDTSDNWTAKNPVLAEGEIGIDKTSKSLKVGDGRTAWNNLRDLGLLRSIFNTKGAIAVGSGPGTVSKLTAGNPGQRLSVRSDGVLMWVDAVTAEDFAILSEAETTYEKSFDSFPIHSAAITKANMAANYETIAACNAPHSTFITQAQVTAAGYLKKTDASFGNYQDKGRIVLKTADKVITNLATMAFDPDLIFAAVANGVYLFELQLNVVGPVTGKIQLSVYSPAGANTVYGVYGAYGGTALTSGTYTADVNHQLITANPPPAMTFALGGAGDPLSITIRGSVINGATSGNVGLQFAQAVADATSPTVVRAGSWIRAYRTA